MKNNLLLTTALVGVAFAFTANVSAQEPSREVVHGSKQVIDGDYHGMTTTTGNPGGVFSVGTGGVDKEQRGHLTLTRGKFYKNFAETDGGAIGNYGDLSVNGTVFEDNVADYKDATQLTQSDNNPIGGGALALGIESKTDITGARFTHNIAGFNGGAIGTRRTLNKGQELPDHYLHIKNSTFNRNMALGGTKDSSNGQKGGGYGGAIATTFEDNQIDDSSFENNFAQNGGGAIYLTGLIESGDGKVEEESKRGGKLTVNNSNFKENLSWGQGGAILAGTNSQELNINGSTFDGNVATSGGGAIWSGSKTEIKNTTFTNNRTTGVRGTVGDDMDNKDEGGGAIFVGSSSNVTIEGSTFNSNSSGTAGGAIATRGNSDGKNSSLKISGSQFNKNHAEKAGGAISIGSDKEGTDEEHLVEITDTDFSGNTSANGGAIYNKGKISLTGGEFRGNTSTGVGGAITNSGGDLTVNNVAFTGNRAATNGGAIYTKGSKNLTITGGSFVDNEAGYNEKGEENNQHNGGAIFAGQGTTLNVTGVTFEGNKASGNGGAVAADNTSTFEDVTFKNNSAAVDGGALFVSGEQNDSVTFKGNVTFEGNTAKDGTKNDINFEKGNGTITVKDGALLSLDGGITVNGTTSSGSNNAKLELEKGSTLSVNNETVIESTVSVNGSSSENARLKLRLAADSDNVFDLKKNINGFEGNGISNLDVDTTNNLYNITGENGVYTATQKSADEVAANLGVKESDAGTVLGMMNIKSTNERFTKVQDTLAFIAQDDEVDSKEISRAADALGADAAPVVQTRETMLANMIFDTANDALDDSLQNAAVGQSSGDNLLEKAKVWVKGLFNYADKDDTSKSHGFDIDTYGVAMGVDKEVSNGKVGLGYAYSESDIDGYTRDTDVDTHSVFVYGQYQPADWYIKGVAAYSWSDYKEKKSVLGENANAKYDVDTLALQGLYGYKLHIGDGYDVTPEAGLRYISASQDAYTNGLGVRVNGRDIDVLTAVAAVKVAKNFALTDSLTIRPEVRAALTYDLRADNNDSVVTMGNTLYSVNGEKLDRFGAELGAKLATDVTANWEVAAGYEGRFRDDYSDHTGILSAKYKF